MLVLFETAAGYAMFKLLSDKKMKNVDNIYEEFSTAEKAQENLQLVAFKKFKSTAEAVESACALHEGKMNKTLKKLLKGKVGENEQLAVGDTKLGNLIKVSQFTSFFFIFVPIFLAFSYFNMLLYILGSVSLIIL
ncbi:NOP5NT domain protein [Cooperia oncophora]